MTPKQEAALRLAMESVPTALARLRSIAQDPREDPQLRLDLRAALAPAQYRGQDAFSCSACGGDCCDAIRHNPTLFADLYRAPDDPTCRHLTPEGRCAIYNDRPLPCRVDATYDFHPAVAREQYYAQQHAMCVLLRWMAKRKRG